MISFEWPWVAFALPLPIVVRFLFSSSREMQQAALRVPFLDDFNREETLRPTSTLRWKIWLAGFAWILLVAATARPQWHGEPLELPLSGRDLMLAVDLSASMEERDFQLKNRQVDRLTATKWVAGDFIQRRVGDRIGLILFGERAYLQTPLTFDRDTVRTLLNESAIGLAGQKTAIGDAIGLAIKRLKEKSANSRVLILLTDGANTAGEVSPLRAAQLAADHNLKIYTIGIGADRMVVRSLLGGNRVINPSRDLDEKTLRDIAETTGGRYFRARNTEELSKIYQLLDKFEPVERERKVFRPTKALFPWPLSAALLVAVIIILKPAIERFVNLKKDE